MRQVLKKEGYTNYEIHMLIFSGKSMSKSGMLNE